MVGKIGQLKIALIGSRGRLGSALAKAYGEEHTIVGFSHAELDLGAPDFAAKLEPLSFDVLINCAALTNVDHCERHREEALRINASAVGELAEICARKKVRCIHISTDYVFDGEKSAPYREEDEARPISVYGESKRRGEIELLRVSPENLAVRVAWVFGPDRPSFIDGVLKRALESEKVDAIADKISAPTFTHDFAKWLRPFLRENPFAGLLHACNAGECSWQQYGQHAIDCAVAAGLPVRGRTVGALKMADMENFVAKRPVYTVLDTGKLAELGGVAPRSWRDAVEDYVANYFAPSQR